MQDKDLFQKNLAEIFEVQLPNELEALVTNPQKNELCLSNQNFNKKFNLIYEAIAERNDLLATSAVPIEILKLDGTHFDSQQDLFYLQNILVVCPDCKILDLSNNQFGDETFEALIYSMQSTRIQYLYLRNVGVNVHVENLSSFFSTCNLVELDLRQNNVVAAQSKLQPMLDGNNSEFRLITDSRIWPAAGAKYPVTLSGQEGASRKRGYLAMLSEVKTSSGWTEKAKRKRYNLNYHGIDSKHSSFIDCKSLLTPNRIELIEQHIKALFVPYNFNQNTHRLALDKRSDCRVYSKPYPYNSYDLRFINYCINQLESGYFIAEGPENEISANRLFSELCAEESTIDTILAIGGPSQGEGYYNYFAVEGNYEDFTVKLNSTEKTYDQSHPHIRCYELIITKKAQNYSRNICVYQINNPFSESGFLLNAYDNQFFYRLCLHVKPKNILIHGDTSLGFAPMIALSMQLYCQFTEIFSGPARKVAVKINRIIKNERKRINEALFPSLNYALTAYNLALDYIEQHNDCIMEHKDSNMLIHYPTVIKKMLVLGGDSHQRKNIVRQLINFGIRPINLANNDWKLLLNSADENLLLPIKTSISLTIKRLHKYHNLRGIIFLNDFYLDSPLGLLLRSLPPGLKTIFVKQEKSIAYGPYQVAITEGALPILLSGFIKKSAEEVDVIDSFDVPKNGRIIGLYSPNPRYFAQYLEKKFLMIKVDAIPLIPTEENFELITYLVNDEGVETIYEEPTFVYDDFTISLQNFAVPSKDHFREIPSYRIIFNGIYRDLFFSGEKEAQLSQLNGQYDPLITQLNDKTWFSIGQQLADRINSLASVYHAKLYIQKTKDNTLRIGTARGYEQLKAGIFDRIADPNLLEEEKINKKSELSGSFNLPSADQGCSDFFGQRAHSQRLRDVQNLNDLPEDAPDGVSQNGPYS
jgi:hypothetical protein